MTYPPLKPYVKGCISAALYQCQLDLSQDRHLAWVYEIVKGWPADALPEIAQQHGWNADDLAELKELHKLWVLLK